MPSRIIWRLSLFFSTISDKLSIHFILILTNNCIRTISSNNMHFTQPDFTISYSTRKTCVLIISMFTGPYITPLCRVCLRIIGKSWGIMGGISGKFLEEFLEVFEKLLAHAQFESGVLPCYGWSSPIVVPPDLVHQPHTVPIKPSAVPQVVTLVLTCRATQ